MLSLTGILNIKKNPSLAQILSKKHLDQFDLRKKIHKIAGINPYKNNAIN